MRFGEYKDKIKGKFTKDKVIGFMDKQGFYIVLFVCIGIIGVTAFMTSNRGADPKELADKDKGKDQLQLAEREKEPEVENEVDLNPIDIKIKDSDSRPEANKEEDENALEDKLTEDKKDELDKEEVKETLASNTQKGEVEKTKASDTKKQSTTGTKKASAIAMIFPVEGNILKDHSMDQLVYSETLKEWTTHPGIDLETFVGAEVKAALGGTVEEIAQDPLMGITITLDHGNNLKTYYANLSTGNMVSKGQKVDKGQIISGVGRTASAEILDKPHLHFEVLLDGKSIDPKSYIK